MTVLELPQSGRIDPGSFPLYPPERYFAAPVEMPDDEYIHLVPSGPDAGMVYGWVHHAGTVLLRGDGIVWTPPPSPSGFHDCQLGTTWTAEGSMLRTANVGGGVNHARLAANYHEAVKHYENTASQLMRVRYEMRDRPSGRAVVYAGSVWPDVAERDCVMMMASCLSGDWRFRPEYNEFDFTGCQLVNNAGLPLRRVASLEDHEAILATCDGEDCCVTCHTASLEQRVTDLEDALAAALGHL